MFIVSTKSFAVKRANGSLFHIPMGFIGEIPDDVAGSLIVKLAMQDGSISSPATKKDKAIDKAIKESEDKAVEAQKAKEAKEAEETKEALKGSKKK